MSIVIGDCGEEKDLHLFSDYVNNQKNEDANTHIRNITILSNACQKKARNGRISITRIESRWKHPLDYMQCLSSINDETFLQDDNHFMFFLSARSIIQQGEGQTHKTSGINETNRCKVLGVIKK